MVWTKQPLSCRLVAPASFFSSLLGRGCAGPGGGVEVVMIWGQAVAWREGIAFGVLPKVSEGGWKPRLGIGCQ